MLGLCYTTGARQVAVLVVIVITISSLVGSLGRVINLCSVFWLPGAFQTALLTSKNNQL